MRPGHFLNGIICAYPSSLNQQLLANLGSPTEILPKWKSFKFINLPYPSAHRGASRQQTPSTLTDEQRRSPNWHFLIQNGGHLSC